MPPLSFFFFFNVNELTLAHKNKGGATHVFDSYIIKYAEKKEKVTLSSRNYYCTFSSWTRSEVRGIMSYAVKLTLSRVNPRELESVVFISLLFKIKSVSFNFRSLGNRFFLFVCLFWTNLYSIC